jgi:hypothetical protein
MAGTPPLEFRVRGAQQLTDLSRQIREVGDRELRAELRRGFRDAGKPVVADLKQAVRSISSTADSHGGGSRARAAHRNARRVTRAHGLRNRIASLIRFKVTLSGRNVGVRVEVDTSGLPPDQRTLPQHLDAADGWRHPVYGNRDAWVTQHGQPWWEVTIARHQAQFERDAAAVMERVADRLTSE